METFNLIAWSLNFSSPSAGFRTRDIQRGTFLILRSTKKKTENCLIHAWLKAQPTTVWTQKTDKRFYLKVGARADTLIYGKMAKSCCLSVWLLVLYGNSYITPLDIFSWSKLKNFALKKIIFSNFWKSINPRKALFRSIPM